MSGRRGRGPLGAARRVAVALLSAALALGTVPAEALAEGAGELSALLDGPAGEAYEPPETDAALLGQEIEEEAYADVFPLAERAEVLGVAEEGGAYVVEEGAAYEVAVALATDGEHRLPEGGRLEYAIPEGFAPDTEQIHEEGLVVARFFNETGEPFELEVRVTACSPEGGVLRVDVDPLDPGYLAVLDAAEAELDLVLVGKFAPGVSEVAFAREPTLIAFADDEEGAAEDEAPLSEGTQEAEGQAPEGAPAEKYAPGDEGPSAPAEPAWESETQAAPAGDGGQAEEGPASEPPVTDGPEGEASDPQAEGAPEAGAGEPAADHDEGADESGAQAQLAEAPGDGADGRDEAAGAEATSDEDGTGSAGEGADPEPGRRERAEYTYEDAQVLVTATLADPQALPDGAELRVVPVTPRTAGYDYDAYIDALEGETGLEHHEANTLLYDVSFVMDGEEVEPGCPVSVSFRFRRRQLEAGIGARSLGSVEVTHLPEGDGGEVTAEHVPSSVSVAGERADFEASSFSVFAFSYTVDFELGGLKYTLPGEGSVSLSRLMAAVGILEPVSEVESAEFSDPALVSVTRDLAGGNWTLRSLAPFDTDETLTISMRSGARYVVDVTDAQVAITSHPASREVTDGQAATFTVKATGTGLSYQWETMLAGSSSWQDTALGGNRTATLSFPAITAYNGRKYRCVVTDSSGLQLTSNAATLTVRAKPAIKTQPKGVATSAGLTATFTVSATGTGLSYQWQTLLVGKSDWQDTGLAGNRTATLSFAAQSAYSGRKYRCVVTDRNGAVATSSAATLTVADAPIITSQPAGVTTTDGRTATFSVAAAGTGLSYQWQTQLAGSSSWIETKLGGCKTATLSFPAEAYLSGRKYRCVVTGPDGGKAYSNAASLTVLARPAVVAQPAAVSVSSGQQAAFSVAASGVGLSYQWQTMLAGKSTWQDTALGGNRTATLSFTAIAAYSGRKYRCVVTDFYGASVPSEAATLTVIAAPAITSQPADVATTDGGAASFAVKATGTGLTYQWQTQLAGSSSWQNTSLGGNRTATLSFAAQSGYNGRKYRCVVTDGNGASTTSSAVTLRVGLRPSISRQPAAVSVTDGQKATFSVAATGTGLSYQWQTQLAGKSTWQDTALGGNRTATLSFPALTAYSGRKYRCVVTGSTGLTSTSDAATLTVVAAPVVTSHPSNVTTGADGTATFSVAATGTGISYQWQTLLVGGSSWQNTSLGGNRTATLSFPVQEAYSGRKYRCRVTDRNGYQVYSNAATLTVRAGGPTITSHPADQTVYEMAPATFSVGAEGDGLTYQWQTLLVGSSSWQNTNLNGSQTATLSFNAKAEWSGRRYRCVVTNSSGGTSYSEAATLTVKPAAVIHTGSWSSTVSTGGERPRFRFEPPVSGTYYLESYQGGDTYGRLYDSVGNLIDYDDDGGEGGNFRIARALEAGSTYYLEANFWSSSATGTLDFSVSLEASVGESVAAVSEAGRAARLRLAPAQSGTYTITSSASSDVKVTLYGQTLSQLAYDDDGAGYPNFRLSHDLSAGTVYYYDAAFYSSSATGSFPVTISYAGAPQAGSTTYRALLVGEVTHEGDGGGLDLCYRNQGDVESMRSMLSSVTGPDGGAYSVTTAVDLSPAGVRDAISSTFAGADSDDVSLFFIATHGVVGVSTGSYAGALSTGTATSTGTASSDLVLFEELASWLGDVPGKVVVVVEACGSGAGVWATGVSENALGFSPERFDEQLVAAFGAADGASLVEVPNTGELRREGKFYVLTASRHQELSWGYEGSSPNNYFTRWLCEGVGASGAFPCDGSYLSYDQRACSGNGDGVVELEELFNYISAVGDAWPFNGDSHQHVQRYPVGSDYQLFRR